MCWIFGLQWHFYDFVEGLEGLVVDGCREFGGGLCLGGCDYVVVDVGEVIGGGLDCLVLGCLVECFEVL